MKTFFHFVVVFFLNKTSVWLASPYARRGSSKITIARLVVGRSKKTKHDGKKKQKKSRPHDGTERGTVFYFVKPHSPSDPPPQTGSRQVVVACRRGVLHF